jgi:hypothetical protein
MASLFEVEDPFGRIIRLDERRWYDHITRYHPLLHGHISSVQSTILEPSGIYEDVNDPAVDCFYNLGALPGYPRQYLKVCVGSEDGDDAGFVITAYATPRIKGTETQIWPTT